MKIEMPVPQVFVPIVLTLVGHRTGYDHITSATGGSTRFSAGADFSCYVTPVEHLRSLNRRLREATLLLRRTGTTSLTLVKGIPGTRNGMTLRASHVDVDRQDDFPFIDPKRLKNGHMNR